MKFGIKWRRVNIVGRVIRLGNSDYGMFPKSVVANYVDNLHSWSIQSVCPAVRPGLRCEVWARGLEVRHFSVNHNMPSSHIRI